MFVLVGVTGFEPAASWSRTKRTTKLCHTPRKVYFGFLLSCAIGEGTEPPSCRFVARGFAHTKLCHTPMNCCYTFL